MLGGQYKPLSARDMERIHEAALGILESKMIKAQLARAPELGVSGVPGYYLASAFLLPGAQAADTMSQIITRVKTKVTTDSA